MSNRMTNLLTAAFLIGAPASAFATPRTLPSGAPACGNTMGKGGGYKVGCTEAQREAWRIDRDRERAESEARVRDAQAKAGAKAVETALATTLRWRAASKA